MKHILYLLLTFAFIQLNAQSPEAFNYQAIALDNVGQIYKNQQIDVQISILENSPGGTAVYVEDHQATTSDAGIFSLQIGRGSVQMGTFPTSWGSQRYYLDIDVDFDGNGFQNMGTSELLSVPYAMHAETVTDKNDADADPMNEIQNLSLNNSLLSISEGNSVNLSGITSPWETVGATSNIKFEQGSAMVNSGNDTVTITPESIYSSTDTGGDRYFLKNGHFKMSNSGNPFYTEINQTQFTASETGNTSGTTVAPGGPFTWNEIGMADLKPQSLTFSDTADRSQMIASIDSIYMYHQLGLLLPDVAVMKPTHLTYKTLGTALESTLGPGAQRNSNDDHSSELNPYSLRIIETTQPDAFDRVVVSGDSINIWNSAKWRTVDIQSDNTLGGTIDLNNASGTNLVEIGAFKDNILGTAPTGNLLLKDAQGVTRNTSGVVQGSGFNFIESENHYVFSGLAGVVTGRLTGPQDAKILDGYAEMRYDTNTMSGEVELFAGSAPERIAYLGHTPLDHESGKFALFSNGFGNKENVRLEASRDLGGQFHLFSKNLSTNFYAGGSDMGGIAGIADSTGFLIAGLETTDWQGGRMYVRNDGSFAVEDERGINELSVLNGYGLRLADSSGAAAAWLTRDIAFPSAGAQWLWGANGVANVYLGLDHDEGELGPSGNYGKIELFDAEANVRAWMSGTGSIGGRGLSIQDFTGVNKIGFGTIDFNGSSWMDMFGANGNLNVAMSGATSGNHGTITTHDQDGVIKAGIYVNEFTGQGHIFGDIKNFRMDHPSDPQKEIWYASLEGPEAAAYVRGTADLVEGETFVPFPDHFQEVCNSETITIQLTPRHWDTYGLAVVEITQKGFIVKELKGATGSFEFDWEAKGVRKGFENYKAVLLKSDLPASLQSNLSK